MGVGVNTDLFLHWRARAEGLCGGLHMLRVAEDHPQKEDAMKMQD